MTFQCSRQLGEVSVVLELTDLIVVLDLEMKMTTIEEGQDTFQTLSSATQVEDISFDPYIP